MRRKERNISDIKTIEQIIRKADVCRIALAEGNIPYIITMNFGYSEGPEPRLYFHCANEGRKLEMIRINNYVCFEMDIDHEIVRGQKSCDWGMKYSSIVGYGNIFIEKENTAKEIGLSYIMNHYGGSGNYSFDLKVLERTTILRLDIKEITGKKC
jgi:nitroimidazol reductase NimA-like FMN-containing flavoprotein (pyridoxamine 5'-phosphate oxidase superfamily)